MDSGYPYEYQYIPEIFTNVHSGYRVEAKIGEGSFGSVYRVTSKFDGRQYALKQVKLRKNLQKTQLSEPQLFSHAENLLSRNSSDCFYICSWIEHNNIFIKMNLMEGNVKDFYSVPFSEEEVIDLLVQVGRSLKILHENNIVHLDIKPGSLIRKYSLSHGERTPQIFSQ